MPKQVLELDSIGDVDSGALRIAVNNALKLLAQDLADRPALDKARTLILRVDLKPELDKNSHTPVFEQANVAWQVATKSPAIGSAGVLMKPQQDGRLFFHSDLPDAPDDETIQDEIDRRRRERDPRD